MSKKNNKYHMEEELGAFESAFTGLDNEDSVLDPSEQLIDEILREFGSKVAKSEEIEKSLDDEVAKILKSVQLSLEKEEGLPESTEDVLDGNGKETPTKTPVYSGKEQMSEPTTETTSSAESELTPKDSKESIDDRDKSKAEQKVKVLSENDSSPIFGDDFAKYFGPEAGLAAEIEIDVDDQFDDGTSRSRTLFRRRRKKYITSDIQISEINEISDTIEQAGEPEEGIGRRGWLRRRSPEQEDIIGEEVEQDHDSEEYDQVIDLSPEEAANAIIDDMGLIRVRLFFGAILCAILLYINIAPRAGLFVPSFASYLSSPSTYLFISACLLIFIMIICIKTVAIGIRDFLLLGPNKESVVTLSCIFALVHTISILLRPQWEGYYPYCAVSATSLMFAEYYRYKSQGARVRTYKAVSGISKPYLVSSEKGIYSGQDATVKYRVAEPLQFVHQTERKDIATRVWSYAAPLVIILSIVCAAVSTIGRGQPQRFIWSLSAMLTVAAPFSLCLSYNLPFYKTARHLGMMGHAITGWSAAEEFSSVDSVIITDTDLFPPGSIILNGLKIYGGYAVDKVISYSASLIAASHAGVTKPFLDLLNDQAAAQLKVTGFQYYENGGIGGEINGEGVIAGNVAFMLRTGIRIPRDINVRNAIFIAINLELAGVFAVNYNVNPSIKKALDMIIKNGLNPVLAIRDFNITQAMIESKFNISSDVADYPPIEDRLALSNPDRMYTSKPLAAIGREGLTHYAESIVLARNLKRATKTCLGITFAGIIIGMLLMFYLLYSHSPVQASPFNLLLYMSFWLVPNLIAARWAKM